MNRLGYIKIYADSETRANVDYLRRLLVALIELLGLQKEISRQWDSNQRSLFPKDPASTH